MKPLHFIIPFLACLTAIILPSCSSDSDDNNTPDDGNIYNSLIIGTWENKDNYGYHSILKFRKDKTMEWNFPNYPEESSAGTYTINDDIIIMQLKYKGENSYETELYCIEYLDEERLELSDNEPGSSYGSTTTYHRK